MDGCEEWRDIKGYEGLYKISSLGRLKSLPRKRVAYGGFISLTKERLLFNGATDRKYITLYKDGIRHLHKVEDLKRAAFNEVQL